MPSPVNVDVRDGRLEVTTRQHVDLIAHVYNRRSDREILKELHQAVNSAQTAGA